ncbi:MAG TPA: trehalose-phosphatase [Marmoricola sp.]|nr:trehalose-phosphatase [Marmoricola sp.]
MEFRSSAGRRRYDDVLRAGDRLVLGLDFDGTLSPIVDDPEQAFAHPGAADAITAVAARVRAVAVVTGRPVRQALHLGGFDAFGERVAADGGVLVVLGQYGNERWSSTDPRIVSPEPPEGLVEVAAELPEVLERADAAGAWVEEKGLAVAVHTRRLPDAQAAFDRALPALAELARAHGLDVEPGRLVVEVRAPGMDKGAALRSLAEDLRAGALAFVGDDLGDVEAFRAVADLRDRGLPGLLVCSGSDEQTALVEMADLVVDGPDGVVAWLHELAADLAG